MGDARVPWVLPIRQGSEIFDQSQGRTPAIVRVTLGIKPNTPRQMLPFLQDKAQAIIAARQPELMGFYRNALGAHGLGIVPITARTLNLQELQARYQNQNGMELLDIIIYPDLAFTPDRGGNLKPLWTHLRFFTYMDDSSGITSNMNWKLRFTKPLSPPATRHVYGLDPVPDGWPDVPVNDWISNQNNVILGPYVAAAFSLEDDLKQIKRPPTSISSMDAMFDITHLKGSFKFDILAEIVIAVEGPVPDLNRTVEVYAWMLNIPKPTDWGADRGDIITSFTKHAARSAVLKVGSFQINSTLQNVSPPDPRFYAYAVEQPLCATATFDGVEGLSVKS